MTNSIEKRRRIFEGITSDPLLYNVKFEDNVIDAGVNYSGGWNVGCEVLKIFTSDSAIVQLEHREIKGVHTPTVSLYMNELSTILDLSDDCEYTFIVTEKIIDRPKSIQGSKESLVHYMYQAGVLTANCIRELIHLGFKTDELMWGYANTPILMNASNLKEVTEDITKMEINSVVSVWIRHDDTYIQNILPKLKGRQEIRIHNLNSGNTFLRKRKEDLKND